MKIRYDEKEKEFYRLLNVAREKFGVTSFEEIEREIKEHPIEIGMFTMPIEKTVDNSPKQ